jgi:predicted flap endonuclease-1-like 5' DNA nuclease
MVKLRYLVIGLVLGFVLAWIWLEEGQAESRSVDSPPDSPSRPAPRKSKDPLTDIDGIGPSYEQALNAMGIFTFAQLAAQNADSLASNMTARVTAERIRREQWIEQARKHS